MKIGIITYWSSNNNYGQILQCFALQKFLQIQGHTAFLIRYKPQKQKISFIYKIYKNLSWEKIKYRLSKQKKTDKEQEKKQQELSLINQRLNKQREFEKFRAENLKYTDTIYTSLKELRKNPPKADLYICGSDQVWNNSMYDNETPAWFLDFGDSNIPRISFAASIGRDLEVKELKIFKKLLSSFYKISVREEKAKLLCDSIGIKNVKVVLDPTFLIPVEEYRKLQTQKTNSSPYIFIYILNIASKEEIYWNSINNFAHNKKLSIRIVSSSGYIEANNFIDDITFEEATIPEWLSAIDEAQYVISTSFHGIVFCLKMHKPFLAVLLTNEYSSGNIRIQSLLKRIGLENRIYNPAYPIEVQIGKPINWEDIDNQLNKLIGEACEFLKI